MSSQQTPPRQPTFSTNSAIRALASVAVGALVFGLVFGLRRDKTTTTDRVVARPASAAAKQRPPNLIVFLADDLGRNDVGYAHRDGGPGRIASPRIDALAAESLVLDRFYAQPMCTPTRAALMTGRHAYKTGLAYFVLLANQGTGLPAAEVTVAERLRDAGYSTHMIGKWHLGFAKKAMLPTSRGFDRFFGYCLGSSDYWLHQSPEWVPGVPSTDRATGAEPPTTGGMGHDLWDGATPLPRTPKTENVGNVVDGVRASRGWENTVLWFMGDNGPEPGTGASSWPLRGAKRTLFEGGVREPSFVYAPGRVAPGASSAPVHVIDVAPTLLGLAGSAARGVDGVDARLARAPRTRRRPGRSCSPTTPSTAAAPRSAAASSTCSTRPAARCRRTTRAGRATSAPRARDARVPLRPGARPGGARGRRRGPPRRAHASARRSAAEAASVPSLVEITPGDDRAAPDRHGGSWVSWLD
ncbi:sulfuric ester hydrolase [Aureococcus anophagefferens]|nr:sulfuric ester hydrolase [Aureococcus anophagefferens]